MLEVQKFLQDHGQEALTDQLAIKVALSDSDPLMILNYNQIESPKTHPIVRECRGLVLHSQSYDLVARSFSRFFNWGEVQDEMDWFDFTNFGTQTKEDGSLVLIYNFDGRWRVNTRGSFAQDLMQFQEFTWQQGICEALQVKDLSELDSVMDSEVTYVCEFCSPWNKVVRSYPEPQMFLLSAFRGLDELSHDECDSLAKTAHMLRRSVLHGFSSLEEVQSYLRDMEASDPTYEGVVIRDVNNQRWKIKNPTYLGLHRLKGEGDNLWNPKHLLPFILAGETDELLTYFKEVKPAHDYYTEQVDALREQILELWERAKGAADQKSFALMVKDSPLSSVLFTARKTGEPPEQVFRQSAKLILNKIKKFHALDAT